MHDGELPEATKTRSFDVHRASQNLMLYGILPLWIVPGFADYLFHRKSSIETTSGTHESMIHALQMTSIGVPTLMTLLLEINASVIATTLAATAVHEVLTLWDVAYADSRRRPEPSEQHVHSFLEVLPVMALGSILTLHPHQTAALFGRGDEAPDWNLRFKQPPLRRRYLAGIFGAVFMFLVVPYAEELVRCFRTDRTFAAHPVPPADAKNAG